MEIRTRDSCLGSWRSCEPHTRFNADRPLAVYTEPRNCRIVCRLSSRGPALSFALPARAHCLQGAGSWCTRWTTYRRGSAVVGRKLSNSLVTLLCLTPATFIIWFAAVRSLTASERLLVIAAPATGAGLLPAGLLGFSFFNLLRVEDEDPEARCWALTTGGDLRSRWESRPNVGYPEGRGVWVSGVDLWAMCASRMTEAWVSSVRSRQPSWA